ncbi:MAG: sulfatase [Planctomycetes bacterium]|nr:sulfatase [Planctomycetota bacterium]
MISIDTLRPDHLSCYGHPRETSPNLDRLARRGVRFTDVTAAAPWTLPSHASLLTGLYPSRHGVKSHQTRLPQSVVTVAEEFQAAGFETLAVVNTHNVGAPQYQLGQGFEHFRYISEVSEDRQMKLRVVNMGEVVVAEAEALLTRRDAAKPFFLFLHFYDAHTDWTPSADFRRELVRPYSGALVGDTQELNRIRNLGQRLGPDDLRFLGELYDAEIRTLDQVLGGFLDRLEAQGLLADALVLVTSDHGEEFQEHGGLLHGRTQYQELLRVPLILAGPGIPSGAVVDVPAHGVDVTPTLLAVLGISTQTPHDGLDLSPTWRGGTLRERALFGEADQDNRYAERERDMKQMVRRGGHKLIVDRAAQRLELYDLARDPGESQNLVAEEAERVRTLGTELKEFLGRAVMSERIPLPSAEERRQLEAMGYGGDARDK